VIKFDEVKELQDELEIMHEFFLAGEASEDELDTQYLYCTQKLEDLEFLNYAEL
jgi:hypothetical protein